MARQNPHVRPKLGFDVRLFLLTLEPDLVLTEVREGSSREHQIPKFHSLHKLKRCNQNEEFTVDFGTFCGPGRE